MTQQTLREKIREIVIDIYAMGNSEDLSANPEKLTNTILQQVIEWVESKRNKYDKNQETAEFRGGYENALDELIAQLKEEV